MKMIVGLGNPGTEYELTYHNAGLLALEALMVREGIHATFKPYKKIFMSLEKETTVYVHPLTYMNESGKAVALALKKYNMTPSDLVVLHDDSDIEIGEIKHSFARNSGGHKGVQSIIDSLGTNQFHRFRIGIRPLVEARRKKAGEFALKPISQKDQKTLKAAFLKIPPIDN